MSDLRKDPTRGRWVLVRPASVPPSPLAQCPLCPGSESLSPPEIVAYRQAGSVPGGPGWSVRVVPEADPYFRVEQGVVREGVGLYDRISPRGATELIVESPGHDDTPAAIPEGQWAQVLWMYRERLRDLKRDVKIRDILITRRHRVPRARITHPYSRLTAIPIIFDEVRRKLRECREYYEYKRRCVYCDIIRQEIAADERVVRLTDHFVVLSPYAARTPFEMVLYTAPNLTAKVLPGEWATIADDYHWHVEVTPTPLHLVHQVGGIHVNETPPEDAARRFREAWT